MKSNKFWIAILSAILIVSIATAIMLRQGAASRALVYQDGKLTESISLTTVAEPYNITVKSDTGMNVIAVESGRIRVTDADCADRQCVRQGWISGGVTPIVCLPHRLVIELERIETPEVDAVAR